MSCQSQADYCTIGNVVEKIESWIVEGTTLGAVELWVLQQLIMSWSSKILEGEYTSHLELIFTRHAQKSGCRVETRAYPRLNHIRPAVMTTKPPG